MDIDILKSAEAALRKTANRINQVIVTVREDGRMAITAISQLGLNGFSFLTILLPADAEEMAPMKGGKLVIDIELIAADLVAGQPEKVLWRYPRKLEVSTSDGRILPQAV